MFPFLVLTRTSNITAIAKLLFPRGQTNTTRPHCSISSYIYEPCVFPFKLLVPRGRSNTTRPHWSISSYIRSTYVIWGITYVPILGTHVYNPLPSRSSWFLRVRQVGPCRRPDNRHYPLSDGVSNLVRTWALPTVVILKFPKRMLE